MSITREAAKAMLLIQEKGYVNEYHDGKVLMGDKEVIVLDVFLELLRNNMVDMSSGNHLYTTYKPTNKGRTYKFIE